MIQSPFQAQSRSEKVLDLEIIDEKISWLNNKTLREKMMSINKENSENERLFVTAERR